ncbi:MAG: MbnP family protein [Flavobacteriales bacterium]
MRAIFFVTIIGLLISSCGDDTPTPQKAYLQLDLQPVFGNQTFYMDSIYTTQEGYKIKFTELKCYFTLFANLDSSLHQAALFDYRENGSLLFKKEGNYQTFPKMSTVLGVDASLNHLDPSAFPNESPLNISNAGPMHWGWNPGYIFMNIEGKVDTIPDAVTNTDLSFSFHIGTDPYSQNLQFDNINWQSIAGNTRQFKLKLDLLSFLGSGSSAIHLNSEYLTHTAAGQELLTQKVITNFKNAISPF